MKRKSTLPTEFTVPQGDARFGFAPDEPGTIFRWANGKNYNSCRKNFRSGGWRFSHFERQMDMAVESIRQAMNV